MIRPIDVEHKQRRQRHHVRDFLRRKRKAMRRAVFAPRGGADAVCVNCGQPGPHYAPPSMGEEGFFICATDARPSAECATLDGKL